MIGSPTDSPVGRHQRDLVSQVKVKLNPAKFSKMYVLPLRLLTALHNSSANQK